MEVDESTKPVQVCLLNTPIIMSLAVSEVTDGTTGTWA